MTDEKLALVEKLIAESEIVVMGETTYHIVSVQNGVVTVLDSKEESNASTAYHDHIPIGVLVKSDASLYRLTHFLDLKDLA